MFTHAHAPSAPLRVAHTWPSGGTVHSARAAASSQPDTFILTPRLALTAAAATAGVVALPVGFLGVVTPCFFAVCGASIPAGQACMPSDTSDRLIFGGIGVAVAGGVLIGVAAACRFGLGRAKRQAEVAAQAPANA